MKISAVFILLLLASPVFASDENPTVKRINKTIQEAQRAYDKEYERSINLWMFLEEDYDRDRVLNIQEERNDILRSWGGSTDNPGHNRSNSISVDSNGNLILPSYLE